MSYQIFTPFPTAMPIFVNGEDFKDAIKNYVKMNYDLRINNMIIADQASRYMGANLNYYKDNHKNKLGIQLMPMGMPLAMASIKNGMLVKPWPYGPTISYDTKVFPAETYLNMNFGLPVSSPTTPVAAIAPAPGTTAPSTTAPGTTAPGTTTGTNTVASVGPMLLSGPISPLFTPMSPLFTPMSPLFTPMSPFASSSLSRPISGIVPYSPAYGIRYKKH